MRFLEKLEKNLIVFDGAMGTMLFKAGLSGGECPESWNETHPDEVKNIHRQYFKAGCDVVETNTFGGSSIKLNSYGLADKAYQLNQIGAQLAKSVAPKNAFVAGSVGPTGQFLKPLGSLAEEDLFASYAEQVKGLEEGGADIICIETMMDIDEAVIAARAAKENTSLPIVATMTFNKTPNGYFTMMGVTPAAAAEQLEKAGADVIGANCGNGPDEMMELVPLFTESTELPLLFQSNAGMPKLIDGKATYDMGPDEYAEYIPGFIEAGARLIGGCCGTTPEHMKKVVKKVKKSLKMKK